MKIYYTLFLFFTLSGTVSSQDSLKALTPDDFTIWKTIQDTRISADGKMVVYRLVPGEGDPALIIHDVNSGTDHQIPRVSRYEIDYAGGYIFGLITPHRDSLRALERKKVEKKDWPSDTLFIYTIASGETKYIPSVMNFRLPEKFPGWIAYTIKKEAFEADTVKVKKKKKKESGHLVVYALASGMKDTLMHVKEFVWSEKSPVLLATVESTDSLVVSGVYLFKNSDWKTLKRQKGEYSKLSLSPDGSGVSFMGNHDTTKAQVPPLVLYFFNFKSDSATVIAQSDMSGLPVLSPNADLIWSDDNSILYYGRAERPFIKDTTLLEDESVNVEIWRTEDPVLYTVQNVNKPNEEKRFYHFAYHTATGKHVQINAPQWESVTFTPEKTHRTALVYTNKPYQLSVTWLGDAAKDLAIVDIHTGKVTPFKKEIFTSARLSPGGKYAYGYSESDTTWWVYHTVTGVFSFMNSKGLPSFYNELHDVPGLPNNYGFAGWTEDDEGLLIYDRYDIWEWSPLKGKTPVKLTNGREHRIIYRYIHTDPEEYFVPSDEAWLIHATSDDTKASGYTWLMPATMEMKRPDLVPYKHARQVSKARNADVYVFRKENFQTYPDLEITHDRFSSAVKISNANPQQQQYKWGTIELYEWMDWDSVTRRGMLVKPFGFDTLRSYPMIVNFYERSSDELHDHPTPEPHRSTINYAYYASRGYAIFNPDISYEIGYPGESAYKIVMSGVQSLVKKRVADPQNLALQGHSWGGYQVAYIVTRTDLFKCAEAGASVVNMTSAYGGIRWGTGLARMFQYEKSQSRLGKSLWEDPQLYIVNSPLFKIDKINTPLLLMHNDEDAAVPFEQGIEFYLALRRLGKKAWLLNYRGEPHWPVKWHNRMDFQSRMSQFFDHYLKGAPMPRWMESGIPAMQRGIDRGY